MDSFYMILPSNSCPNTRPDNSANKFTVDYENAINLHGEWDVAMTDILLLYCPQTIKQGTYIEYQPCERRKHKMELKKNKLVFTPPFPEIVNVIYQTNKFIIETTKKIAITFKKISDAWLWGFNRIEVRGDSSLTFYIKPDIENSSEIDVVIWEDNRNKIFVFQKDVLLNNTTDVVEYFKTNCSHIFKTVNVVSNLFTWELQDTILTAKTTDQMAITLGLKDSTFSRIGNGERTMKLNSAFNQIYIYSSIVSPIMVGSEQVPLLRCTWIDTTKYKSGDVVFLSINHPMYLPVSTTCINKIEVNIRDDSGELLNFFYGAKTIITLHFKKRIRKND